MLTRQRTCRARGLHADTNADGGALAVAVVVDVADGDSAADSPRNGEPLARSAVAARGTDKTAAGCRRWRWRSCARWRSQVIRACTAYNAAKYGRRRAALRDALRDAEPDFEPNREPDCDPDCAQTAPQLQFLLLNDDPAAVCDTTAVL